MNILRQLLKLHRSREKTSTSFTPRHSLRRFSPITPRNLTTDLDAGNGEGSESGQEHDKGKCGEEIYYEGRNGEEVIYDEVFNEESGNEEGNVNNVENLSAPINGKDGMIDQNGNDIPHAEGASTAPSSNSSKEN
ncbi:uncharacterized protein LOC127751001 isoform X1 [Frankliniella occidentalis]|uniref:Uncharacterized protein LOC127751001 isoform X1 n=1 Tax=Frankliniella occidentalis TaxID=133901 RepID=A0A9C6X616_FRAOC|nr:uncharacterized protein LOC127751001 isoform X1 [Frankliniella occidentalis]